MASIYKYPVRTVPGKQNRPVRTRWHVRMELGRGKVKHLGVFPTKKLADDKIQASWEILNRGGMPVKTPQEPVAEIKRTVTEVVDAWLKTRVDVAERTLSHFTISSSAIKARFGTRDPATVSTDDVQEWIHEQIAHPYAPATVSLRVRTFGAILAYAKVTPNPCRDPDVRKPKRRKKAHRMPTRSELALILDQITRDDVKRCIRLIEETGMRVSEAVDVRVGDWDRRNKRLLVPDSETSEGERYAKTAAGGRWIVQIDGLPAVPDFGKDTPPQTKMFPGLTHQMVRSAMVRACEKAGIRRYSPKDLRDLSASRILAYQKLSLADCSVRLGHSNSAITLSVYNHSLPPEEE